MIARKLIKALGDHENPHETAYTYEVIELNENGTFIRRVLDIGEIKVRMKKDGGLNRWEADGKLIPENLYKHLEMNWNDVRVANGYPVVTF